MVPEAEGLGSAPHRPLNVLENKRRFLFPSSAGNPPKKRAGNCVQPERFPPGNNNVRPHTRHTLEEGRMEGRRRKGHTKRGRREDSGDEEITGEKVISTEMKEGTERRRRVERKKE